MPESDARKKWTRENTTEVRMKLNNKTDKDILDRLELEKPKKETGGKQGYIKRLIRNDIEKEGKK